MRHALLTLLAIPLLPVLLLQALKVRRQVPRLPEAEHPSGFAPGPEPARPELRLLVAGESTMAGVGVRTHEEGFAGSLAHELARRLRRPVRWQVLARSGSTAESLRREVLPALGAEPFDLVVLGLGANDAFALRRPARWKAAVGRLLDALGVRLPGVPVLFCALPPIGEFPAFPALLRFVLGRWVGSLGRATQELAARRGDFRFVEEPIRLGDWLGADASPGRVAELFSDGVHPSRQAYQAWAADMAARIARDGSLRLGSLG